MAPIQPGEEENLSEMIALAINPPDTPPLLSILSRAPLKQRCRRGSVRRHLFFSFLFIRRCNTSSLVLPLTSPVFNLLPSRPSRQPASRWSRRATVPHAVSFCATTETQLSLSGGKDNKQFPDGSALLSSSECSLLPWRLKAPVFGRTEGTFGLVI